MEFSTEYPAPKSSMAVWMPMPRSATKSAFAVAVSMSSMMPRLRQ